MADIIDIIREGIKEMFFETEDITLDPDTRLGDIPDWDSMNIVNLQTYLEQAYPINIPLDLLTEETTVGELIKYIEWRMAKLQDCHA